MLMSLNCSAARLAMLITFRAKPRGRQQESAKKRTTRGRQQESVKKRGLQEEDRGISREGPYRRRKGEGKGGERIGEK